MQNRIYRLALEKMSCRLIEDSEPRCDACLQRKAL